MKKLNKQARKGPSNLIVGSIKFHEKKTLFLKISPIKLSQQKE